ncbi:energy-coupling factor transport system permease protein [Anaerovirgula multivorans]|uniref:Energy-coupling factor transport system permease protein n=1 Tax=Anaerovirgula multivorans TaxID=312168 RepID=A0A239CA30_9FIRM|nr:energy-coupling factor transporter transmembrane component T [Anaerovirgula multivorans]SNS16203.1 energy-coupling factor transport system permease protein [Anaerovirgula multivorans]
MYVFERKEIFFQTLHPVTLLLYILIMMIGTILTTNPFILMGFMTAVVFALIVAKSFKTWIRSLRMYGYMVIMLMTINLFINNMGATVLWVGPVVPVFGRISISLEAIIFGLVMGLRLFIIYSLFIFYNRVMDPDKALSVFSKVFPKSALLVALTTKTIPYMSQQLQSASEIQQCRGLQYYTGNHISRIKNRLPLIKVLLFSSLEDSFNLGESMQARAYGSGPRSCYYPLSFGGRDILVSFSSTMALLALVWSRMLGWTEITFYPKLGTSLTSKQHLYMIIVIGIFMILPVLVAWGWEKWDYLKLKI